jgi:cobyrinic acid a,c-diamide synthase
MTGLLISAAHKSSGKTTVSVGLCAALVGLGQVVQAFKKGPDYIDPMWLSRASGRACFNLDSHLSSAAQVQTCYSRLAAKADISIVEGNKGLYDGLALDGANSNAALATLLGLPVVLVIDARGMTRGIAPLILGYQAFDPGVRIAGVILNQVGGSRHEDKLRAVIEHYTPVKVLGAIAQDPHLAMVERHLGLVPQHEVDDAHQRIEHMGRVISAQVDLHRVREIARTATPFTPSAPPAKPPSASMLGIASGLRVGIAQDKAFGFYYPDDLCAFERTGASLHRFDCLNDSRLPDVDALFIGGGFPEMFMAELEANSAMRSSIRAAIDSGMPVYAECGGLMYLARRIRWGDQSHDMVGALPVDVRMHSRPVGRGYVELTHTQNAPWTSPADATSSSPVDGLIRGHEFHHSAIENAPADLKFAYSVQRGHGVDGQHDGIVHQQVLASYAHLRTQAGSTWVSDFVKFAHSRKIASTGLSKPGARHVKVNGRPVWTDVEGYLLRMDDWSEGFTQAQAQSENLLLTDAHWAVIRFLRQYFEEHRVQAQVRTMISHFSRCWGAELGSNHHLHTMFPMGGPQKQGNRLAGLWKTKGEH